MTDEHIHINRIISLLRESIPNAVEIYTKGNCFKFALLMCSIVKEGDIYYDEHHATYHFKGKFYDITGEVEKSGVNIKEHYRIEQIYNLLK